MPTAILVPDAIISSTNLAGAVTDIDEELVAPFAPNSMPGYLGDYRYNGAGQVATSGAVADLSALTASEALIQVNNQTGSAPHAIRAASGNEPTYFGNLSPKFWGPVAGDDRLQIAAGVDLNTESHYVGMVVRGTAIGSFYVPFTWSEYAAGGWAIQRNGSTNEARLRIEHAAGNETTITINASFFGSNVWRALAVRFNGTGTVDCWEQIAGAGSPTRVINGVSYNQGGGFTATDNIALGDLGGESTGHYRFFTFGLGSVPSDAQMLDLMAWMMANQMP